jgi:hypothetical protein
MFSNLKAIVAILGILAAATVHAETTYYGLKLMGMPFGYRAHSETVDPIKGVPATLKEDFWNYAFDNGKPGSKLRSIPKSGRT